MTIGFLYLNYMLFFCVYNIPVPSPYQGYGVHTSRGVLHTPLFESPHTPNQSMNSTNVLRFITRLTDKLSRNFQLTPGFKSLILKLYGGVRAYAIRPYTNSRLKKGPNLCQDYLCVHRSLTQERVRVRFFHTTNTNKTFSNIVDLIFLSYNREKY